MFILHVSAPVLCNDHGGQKRESDPMELELWMVVNRTVGAGNGMQDIYSSRQCT